MICLKKEKINICNQNYRCIYFGMIYVIEHKNDFWFIYVDKEKEI